jgi:transposase
MSRKRNTTGRKARRKGPTPPPDDKWRIPDVLWEHIKPLLPRPKPHPLGCHNPPVEPRKVMDAIFFVLRTGCQWNALNATGMCSSSSAHRWFQVWTRAGVFRKLWKRSLKEYDQLEGIEWAWQSMDGAMTKAPLGGEKHGTEPHRSGQAGRQAQRAVRGPRRADRLGGGRRQPQ